MSNTLPKPGISLGLYPEKCDTQKPNLSSKLPGIFSAQKSSSERKIISQITAQGDPLKSLSEIELKKNLETTRYMLLRNGLSEKNMIMAFALIREFSARILGMRHHDVQVMGAWAMMNNNIIEMETGEGKTLTATLTAGTAALAGIPTHILTTNYYLAQRDAQSMRPLYSALSLTVGIATEKENDAIRRAAYQCDITYCTSKQVAFDYLRDKLHLKDNDSKLHLQLAQLPSAFGQANKLFLRGLCFAIVDEADSVLADEAMNPLVIANELGTPDQDKLYQQAISIVNALNIATDFNLNKANLSAELTATGEEKIQQLAQDFDGVWKGIKRRKYLIEQGICAVYLYEIDKHYLVENDEINIIDQNTGRLMQDRAWERGLHQMIECKEGCTITGQRKTLAKLTFQRFFRRYQKLAGMSGTVTELKRELKAIYRLNVILIPTHQPNQRLTFPTLVFTSEEAKWMACIYRIRQLHKMNRPILIGTRSVAESDHIGVLLNQHHLPHRVLSAKNTQEEAEIISKAGMSGAITVATNVAGRGTDITLDEATKGSGGLHVIVIAQNDAWRIDRQLIGRCARQGDPGSYELMFSLEDPLFEDFYPEWIRNRLTQWFSSNGLLPLWTGGYFVRWPQFQKEKEHRCTRFKLLKVDEKLNQFLSFSGKQE